jgi:hypothetical protein
MFPRKRQNDMRMAEITKDRITSIILGEITSYITRVQDSTCKPSSRWDDNIKTYLEVCI